MQLAINRNDTPFNHRISHPIGHDQINAGILGKQISLTFTCFFVENDFRWIPLTIHPGNQLILIHESPGPSRFSTL